MSLVARQLRELERVEHRVLGAIRFVDEPMRTVVTTLLELRGLDGRATFVRNRNGLWIVDSWSELADHAAAFEEPPPAPPTGSLTLRVAVRDPAGVYLPRRVSLDLPRDPSTAESPDFLFRPVEVVLYPSAAGATRANWAVLRVSVSGDGSDDVLGGAFVRVRGNDGVTRGRGVTDGRGEAMVPIVGVPMLTYGEDDQAVVVDEVVVDVEACFDPSEGTRMPREALLAGEAPPIPEVDPDTLEAGFDSLPQAALPIAVAARRSQGVDLVIDLP